MPEPELGHGGDTAGAGTGAAALRTGTAGSCGCCPARRAGLFKELWVAELLSILQGSRAVV